MYQSASWQVCGPPATGRYHRLGLSPPRYHPKLTIVSQFQEVAAERRRKKKREKNLSSLIRRPQAISSPRAGRRNISDRTPAGLMSTFGAVLDMVTDRVSTVCLLAVLSQLYSISSGMVLYIILYLLADEKYESLFEVSSLLLLGFFF
ncbi:hypothetical protein BHE74_00002783, partial [Ensete ventricosum]